MRTAAAAATERGVAESRIPEKGHGQQNPAYGVEDQYRSGVGSGELPTDPEECAGNGGDCDAELAMHPDPSPEQRRDQRESTRDQNDFDRWRQDEHRREQDEQRCGDTVSGTEKRSSYCRGLPLGASYRGCGLSLVIHEADAIRGAVPPSD
jgi:hypothetical protein